MFKYYQSACIVAVLTIIGAFLFGGLATALIVTILAVLEISLSFDNAVVNATILKNWDATWRARFIRYGVPVAVFGMRLIFPLAIVAIIVGIGPVEVVKLAIQHPDQYAAALSSVHNQVSAFGGAFLMMIFLNFFTDAEKDEHWLSWIEEPLSKVGKLDTIQIAITAATVLLVSTLLPVVAQHGFVVSGMWGIVTYILAESVGTLAGGEEAEEGNKIIKATLGGFLYLELLDASFSFDGVLGSFALSNNIFVIAAGLGIGAMFVRSMTLQLVDKGVLASYRYLEHGAFYAIAALSIIMFTSTVIKVPQVITGLIGATLIGAALWSSIQINKIESSQQSA